MLAAKVSGQLGNHIMRGMRAEDSVKRKMPDRVICECLNRIIALMNTASMERLTASFQISRLSGFKAAVTCGKASGFNQKD